MNDVRTKICGWKDLIQRAHAKSPIYAMYTVKLVGYLAELLGMHNLEEFVPLGAEAVLLHALTLRHGLVQCL